MWAIARVSGRPHRFASLDAARGIALAAMIVFHCAFDLDSLGLAQLGIDAPGWRWFARIIAGGFLTLSGASLVIAHGQGIRWRAYLKRLVLLAGSAMLVTLATWFAMPEEFIFFGILHSITVASVIGLAFLRAPPPVTLLCAGAALILPNLLSAPIFNAPPLQWIGLGTVVSRTMDFEPMLPWIGPFLIGMAATNLFLPSFGPSAAAAWSPSAWPGRLFAWAGRHSLAIYLLHQPLMFGALALLAQALGAPSSSLAEEDRPFMDACRAACAPRSGVATDYCRSYCLCAANELKKQGLWRAVVSEQLAPDQQGRLAAAMQLCAQSPR
jgi:uncharacterized membrane protein